MPKYIIFVFYYANYLTFNNTITYKTIAKCELYLLHLEKSISNSLYHGITTTYKTQLTNQRTSIHAIILEYHIYHSFSKLT